MSAASGHENRNSYQPPKSWFSGVTGIVSWVVSAISNLITTKSHSSTTEVELVSSNPILPYPQQGPQPTNSISSNPESPMYQETDHDHELPKQEEEEEDYHPVIKIIRKQELGRHILVLAIPMMMGIIASYNPLSMNACTLFVVVALLFGFAAIWNGILLAKTYPKVSVLILVTGIGLMLFAFLALVGCLLPLKLKWIPVLCWFFTLFPLAKAVLRILFSPKKKVNDPEKGKNHTNDLP
ncbi:hypothetical protein O6P43_032879 [Quillaja saponaria]|uniref:Uncharacterized protein n=1 Tax=Quillaja saponaria TaxID=32244 RepID=A0AAD7P628_QUISA|nr:hypothetical protein O6P43_032879 [Quillaja saponaria]